MIDFQRSLQQSLTEISFQEHHSFTEYGAAQWAIVDVVNTRYNMLLKDKFDLYHWLWYHEEDELAYFLIEAGSNALHAGQEDEKGKVPIFHLWLGSKGFIVGVEQEKTFNAQELCSLNKERGGLGFFQRAKQCVFFDHPRKTNIIYCLYPLNVIK